MDDQLSSGGVWGAISVAVVSVVGWWSERDKRKASDEATLRAFARAKEAEQQAVALQNRVAELQTQVAEMTGTLTVMAGEVHDLSKLIAAGVEPEKIVAFFAKTNLAQLDSEAGPLL
jgi:predicted RecB family endonuclease